MSKKMVINTTNLLKANERAKLNGGHMIPDNITTMLDPAGWHVVLLSTIIGDADGVRVFIYTKRLNDKKPHCESLDLTFEDLDRYFETREFADD
jgi:hypothetical protein